MPKIEYNLITFDSQLEIDYYKYLNDLGVAFIYHPKSIQLNSKNRYTPDFIVEYEDRVEIIETKGYNQFSFMKDNLTHNQMLEKSQYELGQYVEYNGIKVNDRKIVYRKIKYLKSYGFVDYDFKNPNTIANKRKEKINGLESELKLLKNRLKDIDRYLSYLQKEKLSKAQKIWVENFEKENNLVDLYTQYWRDK